MNEVLSEYIFTHRSKGLKLSAMDYIANKTLKLEIKVEAQDKQLSHCNSEITKYIQSTSELLERLERKDERLESLVNKIEALIKELRLSSYEIYSKPIAYRLQTLINKETED